jgi:hypothetical protein
VKGYPIMLPWPLCFLPVLWGWFEIVNEGLKQDAKAD